MADWAKLKVVDLKAELKRRDLPIQGLKAELVARLEESDAAAAPATDETPTDAHNVEPAAPTDDAAAETEPSAPAAPTVRSPVPETTTEIPEPKQTDAAIELSGEPVEAAADAPPANAELQPETDVASDSSQKRKRKSATPSPDEEEIAAKRARALPEQEINTTPTPANDEPAVVVPAEPPMEVEQTPELAPNTTLATQVHPTRAPETAVQETTNDMDMDVDRDVAPSRYPATSALYISNLMRPLRPADVQAHVCQLASAPGQTADDDGVIVQFHLDQIRTHAFVVLASVQAAVRVRALLHDRVWPDESNRKALCVDFVPPDKINDWIAMEQGSGSTAGGRPGRSTVRWEVTYHTGPDGIVEARLQQGGAGHGGVGGPPSRPGASNHAGAPAASDRGGGNAAPPTGPRGDRGGRRDEPPRQPQPQPEPPHRQSALPPPSELDHAVQYTRARPSVAFQLVAPTLARRRVDNMRAFYTRDARRVLGREINRYSFERGDGFVDRGKEVFEGIRPPHRERGGGGGGRGGGGKFGGRGGGGGGGGRRRRGGGGGDRPRSDRYLPGLSGGGGGGRRWEDDRGDRDHRY